MLDLKYSLYGFLDENNRYNIKHQDQYQNSNNMRSNGHYFLFRSREDPRSRIIGYRDLLITSPDDLPYYQYIQNDHCVLDFQFLPSFPNTVITSTSNNTINIWKINNDLFDNLPPTAKISSMNCNFPSNIMRPNPMYTYIISSISEKSSKSSIVDIEYNKVIHQKILNIHTYDSSWNIDGNISYSTHYKFIKLWDTRSQEVMSFHSLHKLNKHTYIQNVENDNILVTCGYSNGYSEIGIMDIRYPLNKTSITLDCTSSPHSFFYDPDLRIIFYSVKGTNTIKAYYLNDNYELGQCKYIYTPKRMSSLQYLPRFACDFKEGDIAKFLLRSDDAVYPLHIRACMNDDYMIKDETLTENDSDYIEYYSTFFGKFRSQEPQLTNVDYLKHIVTDRKFNFITVNGSVSSELEKFFLKEDFSDLTIITNDNIHHPVHKAILAARSSYWKECLTDYKDSKYYLENVNSNIFKKILYYMYTDILEISTFEEYNTMASIVLSYGLSDCYDMIQLRLNPNLDIKCKSTYLKDIEKLYNSPQEYYSDLKFITNESIIHCHTIVAVGISDFFRVGLQFKEGINKEFKFDLLNGDTLKKIVYYFYSRTIKLSSNDAIDIWKYSNQLCLDHLKKLCENYIINNFDDDTVIPVYLEAKKLSSCVQLYALNYIIKRIKNVKGLKNLSEEDLDKIKAYLPINVNIY